MIRRKRQRRIDPEIFIMQCVFWSVTAGSAAGLTLAHYFPL
jgi:hypothetical protein